jgi:hypothetical protein
MDRLEGEEALARPSCAPVLVDFVVGVTRWTLRVNAYAYLLVTDKYPPFSIS